MKEIGGYFELELKSYNTSFHSSGIFLNSGKNALEFILSSIPTISKLWIPYFTCDVVLEPIKKLNIPYEFYHINEKLEITLDIQLNPDEYLLVTNYFGIKDGYITQLAKKYSSQLIVDNAQALYAKPLDGIKTIYSPRKFVGIPDGGIAYSYEDDKIDYLEREVSFDRCSHLLKRIDLGASLGYNDFKINGNRLAEQPIKRISNLSYHLFKSINFNEIKVIRNNNFQILHGALGSTNILTIPDINKFSCPLVYPYYSKEYNLKKKLIENKIFVATYWPNVLDWCEERDLEYKLASQIIPLPIDQRYARMDMEKIINIINNETNSFI